MIEHLSEHAAAKLANPSAAAQPERFSNVPDYIQTMQRIRELPVEVVHADMNPASVIAECWNWLTLTWIGVTARSSWPDPATYALTAACARP